MRVALDVLSRRPNGFFLMVESGLIDKYTHVLDMERAVYDTIMLDNAVKVARDWAAARGDDTLILVIADHTHPISLIGTIDDDMTKTSAAPLRERIGTYDKAEFPELSGRRQGRLSGARRRQPPARDLLGELRPTTTRRSGRSSTIRTRRPSTGQDKGTYDANERYCDMPGAMLRLGNLPKYLNQASIPART